MSQVQLSLLVCKITKIKEFTNSTGSLSPTERSSLTTVLTRKREVGRGGVTGSKATPRRKATFHPEMKKRKRQEKNRYHLSGLVTEQNVLVRMEGEDFK